MSEISFRVGQKIYVASKESTGMVAYIGNTEFSSGKWIGVILDEKKGKNNGTVQGKCYFQCEDGYGAFMRPSQIALLDDIKTDAKSPSASSAKNTPISEKQKSRLPLGSGGKVKSSSQTAPVEKTPLKSSPAKESKRSQSYVEASFVESMTPQFTPGSMTSCVHTLEEKSHALHAQQEIENLKAEITDLNEKLETLKIKRAQDKEKLKEGEKLKIQVEQLSEFKSRIMESQASLQKDLQKARQETKEAVEARQRHVEETEEMMESVELLTLDKEMAEEKAETLQLEMEQLKEKVEELTMDLEILKTEKAANEDDNNSLEGKVNSVRMQQQESHCERLKETLVRMRDMSAHDKHELQKMQKELENSKSEIAELNRTKEKLDNKATEYEATIADLQEQVDAALGAEDMCETLTDRNLNLEERVSELLETVADLEAINDMNDQLHENARESELELREELDLAHAKVREVMKDREASNEIIVDQDQTIKKFRDLVQKMQEQNLDLRHALEKETNKPISNPSEIIDFKKMFTETKAHSKAIDLELRRLEVQQANQHVKYLTQFLPDTFMTRGGDHDAVLVLLLVSRLICKVEIVVSGLKDRYSAPETIDRIVVLKSHAVDQFSFASRMLQMLYMVQASLKQYQHVLNTCNVDLFLKMGTFHPEIVAQERNLDLYIDLLRKDQLDENVLTENMEKTVNYFLNAFPSHLYNESLNQTSYLWDVSKVVFASSNALRTEAARLESLLHTSESNVSDMGGLLNAIKSMAQELESSTKRIKRRMPQDGSSGPISYPQDVQTKLCNVVSDLFKAMRCLQHVSKNCMQQTALITDTEGGIAGSKMKEFLHQATDLVYGNEDEGPDSLKNTISVSMEAMEFVASTLEKGEYDFDGSSDKEPIPPMALRAEAIKNELKDSDHVKYKLDSKEQDLKELRLLLKQKNEEMSEMVVRRDIAEKKLSHSTRDADLTIEKLQRKLDDTLIVLRRKEKEFDETMDQLQSDIESLELEKGELREKLKTYNKRTLYDAFSRSSHLNTGSGSPTLSPTSPSISSSISIQPSSGANVIVKDSPMLLQQIADLKIAYKHATYAKHCGTVDEMRKKLSSLRPLKVLTSGMHTKPAEGKVDLSTDQVSKYSNSSIETSSAQRVKELNHHLNLLQKELRELLVGIEVVDLRKKRHAEPMQHLINHENKVKILKDKISQLQEEVNRLKAKKIPGGSVSTHLSTFLSTQYVKAAAEKDAVMIGRITTPGGPSNDSEAVKLLLQPEQFKLLHRCLV